MNYSEVINALDSISSKEEVEFLQRLISEVETTHAVEQYTFKLIRRGSVVEILCELDETFPLSVQSHKTDQVSLKPILAIITATNAKGALKLYPLLRCVETQALFVPDARMRKLVHKGKHFELRQQAFLEDIPTADELKQVTQDFIEAYSKLNSHSITPADLDNQLTDSFFRDALERKMRNSKHFKQPIDFSTLQFSSVGISTEKLYNCWMETVRATSIEQIRRTQNNFQEKILQ